VENASRARDTRSLIAETFERVRAHELTVRELLESPPACLGNVRVYDVLRRIPKLNRNGAERVCRKAKIWPLWPYGALTDEDRQAIIAHLPPRVPLD
jgi:hypothetical protein